MPLSSMDFEEEDPRPHVVALSFLSQGHIAPLMSFCLKLASSHTIRVTFIAIDSSSVKLGGSGKQPPRIPDEFLNDIFLEQLTLHTPKGLDPLTKEGFAAAFQSIEDLRHPFHHLLLCLRPKVRCIISDCMYAWSQDVARSLGIPRVGFWTASTSSLAVDYFVPLLLEHGDIPVTESNKDKVIDYVPGLNPLRAGQLPFVYHANNFMSTSDLSYERETKRSVILPDDAWIITNSFEELEPKAFQELRERMNGNIIGIGPLVSAEFLHRDSNWNSSDSNSTTQFAGSVASFWKQDQDCLNWLSSKPPSSVVYISFGSVVNLTREEFGELSEGIVASGKAFLWSLRPEGVVGMSEEEMEAFKERVKSLGVVIPWAPQVEVLSHESTGAFVTHCGWNSVLEGICAGVPMLGWPKHAEQSINCKAVVEEMKVGERLIEEEMFGGRCLGREEISRRIGKVVGDVEMRKRMGEIRESARRAAESCGNRLEPFLTFINHLNH